VLAAGGEIHDVVCCGQIYLQCTTGIDIALTGVLCVPSFHVNLVSETQLMSRGVSIYKFNDKVSLTDEDGEVVMRGNIEDGLIKLQCKVMSQQNTPARSYAAMKDWGLYHQRLGHPNLTSTIALLRHSRRHA
jgi:hypothetical protein